MTISTESGNREVFMDDLNKKTTLGDADGPPCHIQAFGCDVPTFVDPRLDLLPDDHRARSLRRLDYHVPFQMRGMFKPEDWPDAYREKVAHATRTDLEGYVLCNGRNQAGDMCGTRATHRTLFCVRHGAALHPADKKMSTQTIVQPGPERLANLNRAQLFMQGFLGIEDLTEDEINNGYIVLEDGKKVKARALGIKFEQMFTMELHRRLNDYLRNKAPSMLKVVTDIAENPLAEEADRLKAAIWAAERTIGKVPEITIHGKTEQPYEQILGGIQSGSREEYRKTVASTREESKTGEIQDAEIIDLEDEDYIEAEQFGIGAVDAEEWNPRPHGSDSDEEGQDVRCEEVRNGMDRGLRISGSSDSGASDDATGLLERAENVVDLQAEAKRIASERKRIKRRRFAARANGSMSLQDQWLMLEFVPIKTKRDAGKWKLKLWPADQVTEKIANRIAEQEYEFSIGATDERLAEAMDAKADELQAKLDALHSKTGDRHGEPNR